jgi:DNA ligase D-like protein (predicted 3'-phosphoesterase)
MSFLGTKLTALGIPNRSIKSTPPIITEPMTTNYSIQKHKAERAGQHYDLRLEHNGKALSWAARYLPTNPGDKVLATRQSDHTSEYMSWEGKIPSPEYGAGTVKLFANDKIEILKSDPEHIIFNVYETNGDTKRYALIHTDQDQWLWINTTPTRKTYALPKTKPKYKNIDINKINVNDSNILVAPKYDGAAQLIVLKTNKPPQFFSYRPSKRGDSKLIDHTFRSPTHNQIITNPAYNNTVLMGELFARNRNTKQVEPVQRTSAALLSNVWRSRDLQQEAPLDNIIYDVLRYKGKDVSKEPYENKIEILKSISRDIPYFKSPVWTDQTPEQKLNIIKDIINNTSTESKEGVVVYDLKKSVPLKSKLFQDYDVYTKSITPGKGRLRRSLGQIHYSLTPKGSIVGKVGVGWSDTERKDVFKHPEQYLHRVMKVTAQEQLNSGAFRVPVFKEWRDLEKFHTNTYIKTKER